MYAKHIAEMRRAFYLGDMINVIKTKSGFKVYGHAGYAPLGQDIVCAAISALSQAFIASVEELTDCEIKYALNQGFINFEIKDSTEEADLLMRSFFIGCRMVADEYPDNVRVTEL